MLSILTGVNNTFGYMSCGSFCCSCSQTGSVFSSEAGVEEFYVEATQTNAGEGERDSDGTVRSLNTSVKQNTTGWEQKPLKYNNLFHKLIIYVHRKCKCLLFIIFYFFFYGYCLILLIPITEITLLLIIK